MHGRSAGASFTLFGPSHLLALLVVGLLIVGALRRLRRSDPARLHRQLRPWLMGLLLFQGVVWRLWLLAIDQFRIDWDLPFHLCSVGLFLLIVYLWRPRQRLFDVLYHWVLSGATLALLIPQLTQGFPHPGFLSMFLGHGSSLFVMGYLLSIQGHRPSEASV